MSRKFLLLFLALAGLAGIFTARALVYQNSWESQTLLKLAREVPEEKGKKVVVEGRVSADADRRDRNVHIHIDVETVDGKAKEGRLIAFFPPDTELEYGQHVRAKGTLRLPDAFETDSGGTFDYPHYLQVKGISAMLTAANLASSTPAPTSLQGSLFALKKKFNDSLEKIFQPPLGNLMEGIILGERRGLPDTLTQAFIASSLIHIVVLSGYVFTLIIDAVLRTVSFLPKKFRFPLAGLFVILFIVMVGASSVALRAGIMAGIGMLARFFNRTGDALRALGIAVVAMGLWNPPALLYDVSFILSVLATFGLIMYAPKIEQWLRWVPERFGLRGIAASTLSVQIFILPALLYYTGNLSYFALPANIIALPVLPWAMLAGFIAGMAALIPGPLGLWLAFVPAFFGQLLLRWIIFVAETVEAIPHSAGTVHAFPLWAALMLYAPLTIFALWSHRSAVKLHPS